MDQFNGIELDLTCLASGLYRFSPHDHPIRLLGANYNFMAVDILPLIPANLLSPNKN
jgi:hypothetical protein